MGRGRETDDRTTGNAINDPDVLWAIIESLLSRLSEISAGAPSEANPVVLVLKDDRHHHRHPNCPLLVDHQERAKCKSGRQVRMLRVLGSAAARAGLSACPACRTHRPEVPP